MKLKTLPIILGIVAVFIAGCTKNRKTMVSVSNTENNSENNILHGSIITKWDVKVVVNGVDFGIIKAGEITDLIEIKGKNIEFEVFDPQPCFTGGFSSVYYTVPGSTICIRNDDDKAQAFRDSEDQIALFDKEYNLEIGYGAAIPK